MQTAHTPAYRIEMFGGLRVLWDGETILQLQSRKPGALLAALALRPHLLHLREELTELLWPGCAPVPARNRLKQTLAVLRQELERTDTPPRTILWADRVAIRLQTDALRTDVQEFEALRQHASTCPSERVPLLQRAVLLYRAELLPGFYDDWILEERNRLNQAFVETLLSLSAAQEERGEPAAAMESARRALQCDPLQEEGHCLLMRLHLAQGHADQAIRQYRQMERVFDTEIGEKPSAAAQELLHSIHRLAVTAEPRAPASPSPADRPPLEPVGGAVPLSSQYYIVRPTDGAFAEAIARRDSIVLVKGPRQIGKTSLLARGLQQAREQGARVVLTDLQRFTAEQMRSAETLFRRLAESIAEQLGQDEALLEAWDPERGWNVHFERFLRRDILGGQETALVWGIDEVDRLFPCAYSSEVFALFRSWHNLRSLHPAGPWSRLTLAMAYATEVHLFITDLNQSPFNVGTRLALEDFTLRQVAELNRRYGSPLRTPADVERFFALLGGCPYLVRRALYEMRASALDLAHLEAALRQEDGPFHDHLHHLVALLSADPALAAIVRQVLREGATHEGDGFYRLRSAGVLSGEPATPRLRCPLYAAYLERHLP